ncbi:putative histidinol-phosphate transaminase transcription regulator AUX/IAA family [Helianthus annuus]|nr:putative histidinol-phosphate transaminase transcription regulator AUX/IAA family [Helianthus annuus]KAJ0541193.1 putative histidinol-phosphate transaminase transcription regulator AUX/IAA family [Helianthus annuus]KAJ0706275.1 putative histidinol-phosphate transaminase transcription regulator AUX/IAA family [Helianthus annuus]
MKLQKGKGKVSVSKLRNILQGSEYVLTFRDKGGDLMFVGVRLESKMGWVKKHENLIVLRTFSKREGLAGLQVGYGVFPLSIIETPCIKFVSLYPVLKPILPSFEIFNVHKLWRFLVSSCLILIVQCFSSCNRSNWCRKRIVKFLFHDSVIDHKVKKVQTTMKVHTKTNFKRNILMRN